MKTLLFNIIIYLLIPNALTQNIQTDINWNGRLCNGGHGICYVSKDDKLTVKTQISYDKTYHELIFRIRKNRIDENLHNRLFSHPVKKNVYLYTFDAPNYLPSTVYKRLKITKRPIKKGDYLWILQNNYWELRVKLE